MLIDWDSDKNQVLINPRFPSSEKSAALSMLRQGPLLKSHVWVATSGSTSKSASHVKWTALSKHALLTSAKAVNAHLESHPSDKWLNPLPYFHVGGIGISARGYLSKATVIDTYSLMQGKWNPQEFYQLLCEHKATLASLVPTQLYDLINLDLTCPAHLRAVIIGGGFLQPGLYQRGIDLGWRLLPSYGLTECSSQVATAELSHKKIGGFPSLKILPHVEISIESTGRIKLKSPSLLTMYALKTEQGLEFIDPKKDEWFLTEDLGGVVENALQVKGRETHFIKIGGESVDLLRLETIFDEIKLSFKCLIDMLLIAVPDERLGYCIHLAAACSNKIDLDPLIHFYQKSVLPFEKIRKIHYLEAIPRSPSMKIRYHEILEFICRNK
jgi:o-succinylbenzoate---CoA ligase